MKKGAPERNRLLAVMGLCALLAGGVVSRAAWVQVWGDRRLEAMARRQFQSKVLIRPRRGTVSDRNGEPLSVNTETRSLAANPTRIQNHRILARLLSKALDLPATRVVERLKGKREFVWIKRQLTDGEMARLKHWKIIDQDGDLAQGLWLVNESKRVYPHGELAAHVLGSVNLDGEGLEGVELWANSRLQGKVVAVSAVRDALGRPAFLDTAAANGSKDGESLQLTLDASLQFAVEQELKSSVARTGARAGTVVVMNAVTGEILALANEPSFNPNDKAAPASHRRNRALTDGYEPGSTLKAVLLATALTKGMRLNDTVYGEKGSFVVQGKRISEAEAHERFEWISLKKMIQVSSNVGAAKLALKVGADSYLAALGAFGLGQKTGTDFPGEISGRIPPRKQWQPLALANIGFGQGVLVTPMQMLRAYAAFFNGGWLVQPSLLKSTLDGKTTSPPRRILSEKVAHDVVDALKAVTDEGGTGLKARLEGYTVAGKTGTAQVVDPGSGRYSRNRYVASFIGSILDVEPKLAIFTALDEPRGSYYASETAAPLFRAVAQAAANRLSLPGAADPRQVLARQHGAPERKGSSPERLRDELRWSLAKVSGPQQEAEARAVEFHGTDEGGKPSWKMPDLVGLTSREAVRALQGHRFQLEIAGNGIVRSQVPEQGRLIQDGATVRLQLGN